MFEGILLDVVFINIPTFAVLIYLYLTLFNFEHKMSAKRILSFVLYMSIIDSIFKYIIPVQYIPIAGTSIFAILVVLFFEISFKSSIWTSIVISLLFFVVQIPSFILFNNILHIDFNRDLYYKIIFTYTYDIIILLVVYMLQKTKFKIKRFRIYELFSNNKTHFAEEDELKYISHPLIILLIVTCFNYAILLQNIVKGNFLIQTFYFLFIVAICIIFSGIYLWLFKELKEYKKYKTMYNYAKSIIEKEDKK